MAMVRNESVARMVMWLCLGTAILSLMVHWRMRTATESLNQSPATAIRRNSARTYSQNSRKSPVDTGDRALGAPLPPTPSPMALPPVSSSPTDQTQVVVNLSDRRVYVYHDQEVIASYPIAVGKKGWETPTGDFQVMHKEQHPIWRHPITGKVFEPGTDSPLGDRWIGFWSDGRNEVGFHGTPNIDLVGTAVSHGCLRMRNSDVRMLYSQVSLGTAVIVRN